MQYYQQRRSGRKSHSKFNGASLNLSTSNTTAAKGLNLPLRELLTIMNTLLLILWACLTVLTIRHFKQLGEDTGLTPSTTALSPPTMRNLKNSLNFDSSTRIPLPLPANKVSVVLMNFSRPRMIKESSLMSTLLSHPSIDEVVLLHSNPHTKFEYVHDKVVNVDAIQENDEMGLSIRFYFCQMVKNPWVIHVDDDMEFDVETLNKMIIEFSKNPKRIVGRYGRDLSSKMTYNGYWSTSTHEKTEVVLTKLLMMEREICASFFEYAHLVWEDVVLDEGEGPLWNGEDIFMSLVANHVYGRENNNYAMDWLDVRDAPEYLKDYTDGKLDISGGFQGLNVFKWQWWQALLRRNRHYSYRGKLWQVAKTRLAASRGENVDSKLAQISRMKI